MGFVFHQRSLSVEASEFTPRMAVSPRQAGDRRAWLPGRHVWAAGFLVGWLLLVSTVAGAQQTLRVAAFNYYPGIHRNADGKIEGLFVDLLAHVAKDEDWSIQYVYGSWSEGLDRLRSGEVDILTSAAFTEERSEFMDFGSEPLLTVWSEVYAAPNLGVKSVFGLRGRRVALMRGDFNAAIFRRHMAGFNIPCEYVELPDFAAVLHAIETGHVDAGVVNSTFGAAKSHDYAVTSTEIVFNPFPIYFAVAKGRHPEVLKALDGHLARWKASSDSIYYRGLKAWLRRDVGVRYVVPRWLWQSVAALVCVTAVIALLNLVLRRRVKVATAGLRASEDRYRILFERTNDGIFVVDRRTGRYLSANAAAERLTGRSVDELRKLTTHEVTPDGASDRLAQIGELSPSVHALSYSEVTYIRPNGDRRVAMLESVRLDGDLIFGVARDITDRKAWEESLRQSREHYRQAAESNRRLLCEVNHRVRNNLGSLLGLVSLIESKAVDVPAFAASFRGRLMAMAQVHNLLADASWSDIGLRTLVASIINNMQCIAPQTIPVDISGPEIRISPRQALPLAMSLLELFANSCKYGAHTSPDGRLDIHWALASDDAGKCQLTLSWRERGGPPIVGPLVPSLGSQLIEGFINHELGGHCELRFPPQGADHVLSFRIDGTDRSP